MDHKRKRNLIVSFRVTPEENQKINRMVALSGLEKQEYLARNMMRQIIVVKGNPRVFKAMRNQLEEILLELKRIANASCLNEELINLIEYVTYVCEQMNKS